MKKARSAATDIRTDPRADPDPAVNLPVNPHPVLRYTTMRLAIFAVALGLLWLVRVRGLLLVALAVLVSGLASYVLLQRERDAVSTRVAVAASRRKARSVERTSREDDIAEELAQADEDLPAGPR